MAPSPTEDVGVLGGGVFLDVAIFSSAALRFSRVSWWWTRQLSTILTLDLLVAFCGNVLINGILDGLLNIDRLLNGDLLGMLLNVRLLNPRLRSQAKAMFDGVQAGVAALLLLLSVSEAVCVVAISRSLLVSGPSPPLIRSTATGEVVSRRTSDQHERPDPNPTRTQPKLDLDLVAPIVHFIK
ncbi:hypothetical protein CRG98_033071 [Punica granatum]|uniref:Uncharacterized protein n=1 Tax=Punica granatum TaxID=22663 RepID=A0A2I0IR88_PUNGR|nr:hypothetical protein CRG98_033071 [Punica granatum]